jgi:hypothetical protein
MFVLNSSGLLNSSEYSDFEAWASLVWEKFWVFINVKNWCGGKYETVCGSATYNFEMGVPC